MKLVSPSKLARAVIGGALASLLTVGIGLAPVHADTLDDQKDKIDQQVQDTQGDLEDLNTSLDAAGKKLAEYQDKLPAAQAKLTAAQAAVSTAQSKLDSLRERLSSARSDRTALETKRDSEAKDAETNQRLVTQLAAQAYRQGGTSTSDLSLLLSDDPSSAAGSYEMANRALAAQNQALASLRSQQAADTNAAARLAAVESEISDLTDQANTALSEQQSARDAAQAAKDEVDTILADTASAQSKLETQIADAKTQLAEEKKEQESVNAEIKERQAKLKAEAEAKAKAAKEAAAKAKKAAAEAKAKKAANAAKLQAAADAAQATADSESSNASGNGASVTKSSWGLIVPAASGGHITSTFGWRATPAGTIDYLGTGGYVHSGQDWGWGGQCGEPIYAAAAGTVEWAGLKSTHGNVVSIDHNIVNGHALTTNYNHMSKVAVTVGQKVKQGQVIGYVGSTGNSTGCHLHFETVVDGTTVNPAPLLP